MSYLHVQCKFLCLFWPAVIIIFWLCSDSKFKIFSIDNPFSSSCSAQKISASASPYERVRYSESQFLRPVCVIGAKSDSIVESLSKDSQFKLCTTLEDVLKTSAEVKEKVRKK